MCTGAYLQPLLWADEPQLFMIVGQYNRGTRECSRCVVNQSWVAGGAMHGVKHSLLGQSERGGSGWWASIGGCTSEWIRRGQPLSCCGMGGNIQRGFRLISLWQKREGLWKAWMSLVTPLNILHKSNVCIWLFLLKRNPGSSTLFWLNLVGKCKT